MTALSPTSVIETGRQAVQTIAGRCLRRRLVSFDCNRCIAACPAGALTVIGVEVRIEQEKCTGCGRCTAVCPAEAFIFSGYDLYDELERCGTFDDTVFTCHQKNLTFPNAFQLPCLGALSVEDLLTVGLKATGAVYFNLTGCPDCDKHQAARAFPALLARVQQPLAEESPVRLIAVTDKENLPHSEPRDRRSFLLDLGGNVVSFVRQRYGSLAQNQQSPSATSRRLPKKNALLKKTIASRVPAVSDSLLSHCFPTLAITTACTLCPRCTGMCPTGALKLERQSDRTKKLTFIAARCTGCGLCAAFCKEKALTVGKPPPLC